MLISAQDPETLLARIAELESQLADAKEELIERRENYSAQLTAERAARDDAKSQRSKMQEAWERAVEKTVALAGELREAKVTIAMVQQTTTDRRRFNFQKWMAEHPEAEKEFQENANKLKSHHKEECQCGICAAEEKRKQ